MTVEMRGEASAFIDAPPRSVYAMIADVTRMGEWSPECVGASWARGSSGPTVGAVFQGTNQRNTNEWTTPNTVIAADEGEEFAWVVGTMDFRVCTWRYRLTPEGEGTRVTESFELGTEEVGFTSSVLARPDEERQVMIDARRAQLIDDMEHTLGRLKSAAEGSAVAR
ncbi:MAG: SRPBCC family protein [Actinomycetota bacterium]